MMPIRDEVIMETINKQEEEQSKKKKLKKLLYWIIFSMVIIYTFFFTRFNLVSYWQVKRDNHRYNEQLAEARLNNEELKQLIDELRTDPEAVIRIARERYGMKKPNEEIIKFEWHND
jgi:cell division protein FtsB